MKLPLLILAIAAAFTPMSFAAELPAVAKQQAAQFEAAIKQYEASVAAQKKAALDQYVAQLTAARRIEEGAKRPAGVAGIDAELAALKAGPIEGNAPADLPAHLGTARTSFIAATKRASSSNDSVRKFTLDGYIKWLNDLQAAYARAKDDGTIAAIEAEKKRARELFEAAAKK